MTIWLRLKLIADAGIVGLPNAGKSTFLASVSAAKPDIADYPFTTLYPNLGVVRIGDFDFVLADIPGLIEGAHEGKGLGDRFLSHIERCNVLLHLVDGNTPDVAAAYHTIQDELSAYGVGLEAKKQIVALSKCDVLSEEDAKAQAALLQKACGQKPYILSSVTRMNVDEVLFQLVDLIKQQAREEKEDEAPSETAASWSPLDA
jgi:GTP-binding protein